MSWTLSDTLHPMGTVGTDDLCRVAVSGTTIAAAWSSALDVHTFTGGRWVGQRVVSRPGELRAVALDGDTLALGTTTDVRIFGRSAGHWTLVQTLVSQAGDPASEFGLALALRGDLLAIGEPGLSDNVGQVVVFQRTTGVFAPAGAPIAAIPDAEECFTTPADQRFGKAVALASFASGGTTIDRLVVGKPDAGQNCAKYRDAHPGHAYLFERTNGGPWSLAATLASPHATPGGQFGEAVAAAGNTLFVSGLGEVTGFRGPAAALTPIFEQRQAQLGSTLTFDGDSLVFGEGTSLEPFDVDRAGDFDGEATLSLDPGAVLGDVAVNGAWMAAADTHARTISVFHQDLSRLRGWWVTINPLVLLLGDQTFVRLTLPDPPPLEIWSRQLVAGLMEMTPRQRQAAARALGAQVQLLTEVHQVVAGAVERDAADPGAAERRK